MEIKNGGVECWILLNKTIIDDKNWMNVKLLIGRERTWCEVLKIKKESVEKTLVHGFICLCVSVICENVKRRGIKIIIEVAHKAFKLGN